MIYTNSKHIKRAPTFLNIRLFLLMLMLSTSYITSAQNRYSNSDRISESKNILLIEAESTKSNLGEWQLIRQGDNNYVEGASGKAHLEFSGNSPSTGDPNSPLEYSFRVPADGTYRLIMMSSKRLEGVRGDLCNDVWVKMDGDFDSATNLELSELKSFIKFFQEGSTKTPEKSWHWSYRAEKGKKIFFLLKYKLKAGKDYTITVAGRSQRFSFDYFGLYDESHFTFEEAKTRLISSTTN